ncbi:MAG: nucleoside deaminase [Bacteroidota bacterium]
MNDDDLKRHEFFMKEAIKEAEEAGKRGDRPIGAVIVHNNTIIGRGSNRLHTMQSDVHHAENIAIINCAPYLKKYGSECIIYSTLEPCIMCLSTMILSHVRKVVFGIKDNYMEMDSFINKNEYVKKRLQLYLPGILEDECAAVFKKYSSEKDKAIVFGNRFTG